MSDPRTYLVLLGAYLAGGLIVSAWRRAAESLDDVGVWIAFSGLWVIAVFDRLELTAWWGPYAVLLAWLVASLLLTRIGLALGRRIPVRGLIWLLGPAHALALAISWFAEARWRRARAAAAPAAGAAAPRAPEAVESVVELGETTLDEVMVPRSEIVALADTATVAEWAAAVAASGRTHIPVYHDDLDDVRGYVRLGDLFGALRAGGRAMAFAHEVRFVPETMRADDLLRELIEQEERIAIVVDEFGGTAGMVRDHDLFEILLGEIEEEPEGQEVVELEPGVFLVEGQVRIDDFNETAAGFLPEGDYETVAGLVLDRLGRIPSTGERLRVDGVEVEIVGASERRILSLRIARLPATSAAAASAAGARNHGDRQR